MARVWPVVRWNDTENANGPHWSRGNVPTPNRMGFLKVSRDKGFIRSLENAEIRRAILFSNLQACPPSGCSPESQLLKELCELRRLRYGEFAGEIVADVGSGSPLNRRHQPDGLDMPGQPLLAFATVRP